MRPMIITALLAFTHVAPALADDAELAAKVSQFEYHASAFDKRVANDDWAQVAHAVKNMADALAEIQKKDPRRDVSKLAKRLADARAKLEAHDRAAAKSADEGKRLEVIARAHRTAIGRARDLARDKASAATYGKQELADAIAALQELAEVAEACTKEALSATPCDLAASRGALAKAMLERALAGEVPAAVAAIERQAASLASDGELGEVGRAALDPDALQATWTVRYAPLATIAGVQLDPARLAPIFDASKALVAKLPAAAKRSRMPAGMIGAPATVVADAKATFPALTVLKVVIGKTWDVETNDFKVPVNRTAHGAALLQKPGESYCRVVPFLVAQPYAAGKYGIAHVDRFDPGFLVSACK